MEQRRSERYTDPNSSNISDIPTGETPYPTPTATDNAQALSRISQEVTSLREEASDVQHLRGQVRWLRGLLIASVFILGGGLVGMALSLRQEQLALSAAQGELADQVEAIERDGNSAEQFSQLAEQLRSLNDQTRTISDQARQLSEQLPDVSLSQWENLQQRLESLEQDIQNDLSGEAVSSRFGQLSDRLRQLLGQPETAPPTEASPAEDSAATPDGEG
ncbi:MAG: hypothetical protein WBB01_09565 [Phormidesmis sp.]